jgi:hypothetical protein
VAPDCTTAVSFAVNLIALFIWSRPFPQSHSWTHFYRELFQAEQLLFRQCTRTTTRHLMYINMKTQRVQLSTLVPRPLPCRRVTLIGHAINAELAVNDDFMIGYLTLLRARTTSSVYSSSLSVVYPFGGKSKKILSLKK